MHAPKVILLVEDSEQDELLTLRALQKNNILNRVDIVRDGQEALDYLFRQGKYQDLEHEPLPQFVLLDLKLPKIDGLDVLKTIRSNEETKLLPVVILTTSNEQRDINSGYDYGANSYVRKPVDFTEFVAAVKNLGLYWLVINEKATPVSGLS